MAIIKSELIDSIVELEVENAVKKHGNFNSLHEAYAVIKEELEEANEALESIENSFGDVWLVIRGKLYIDTNKLINSLERKSVDLLTEAVQVAAMFKKLNEFLKENKIKK